MDRRIIASYAVRRRLSRPLATFSDKEKGGIDLCVADFIQPILRDYRSNAGKFAILCPISFATLSAQGSRLWFMQHCSAVADVMRGALVIEIDGLTRRTPEGRIRETVSMRRSKSRVRTVAAKDPTAIDRLCAEHGADGVAIDAESFIQAKVASAASRIRSRRPNIVVDCVPRSCNINQLRRAGLSHVTEARIEAVRDDQSSGDARTLTA